MSWFRNLLDCLGDQATIHLAYKEKEPVASICTLHFKRTLVYKYGCSDEKAHNLGGMPSQSVSAVVIVGSEDA